MPERKVLAIIEEAIEAEEGSLTGEEAIEELEGWDSLAILSFIALGDERFEVTLSPRKLSEAKTVKDLIALIQG